jgi:hypothetical protein
MMMALIHSRRERDEGNGNLTPPLLSLCFSWLPMDLSDRSLRDRKRSEHKETSRRRSSQLISPSLIASG